MLTLSGSSPRPSRAFGTMVRSEKSFCLIAIKPCLTCTCCVAAAYAGALVSYSIVVSKSLGVPQFNRAYLQKAMMEDNAQYGFMAVYWFLSKPVYCGSYDEKSIDHHLVADCA